MAIVHVQSTPEISGADNGSCVFGSDIAVGNLIVLGLQTWTAALPASYTDNQGRTWQIAVEAGPGASVDRVALAYCENAAAGPCTVSFTMTGARVARAHELSGFTGTGLLDRTATSTALATNTQSSGVTSQTRVAEALAIALVAYNGGPSGITVAGGWTELQEHLLFDTAPGETDFLVLSSLQTVECTWATGAAPDYAAAVAVFGATAPAIPTPIGWMGGGTVQAGRARRYAAVPSGFTPPGYPA